MAGAAGLASFKHKGLWCNGSASDSISEGWEFGSLCPHVRMTSTVSGFVELLAMSSPLPEDWYCVLSDGYVFAHHCVWPVGTVWPSGLRRWLQAPVRKGVGSNPKAVIIDLRLLRTSAMPHPLWVLTYTAPPPGAFCDPSGRPAA